MGSSKIQEYNLDPNMGLAKEESVQEVKTVSDEIKALIGTEIATQLSTLKTDIIAAMPSGSSGLTSCIRKIQRGRVHTSQIVSDDDKVALSGFTNLNKMIVLIDSVYTDDYDTSNTGVYVEELTKTYVQFGWKYEHTFSYQVIEFY